MRRDEDVVDVLHRLRREELVAIRDEDGGLQGIVTQEQLSRALRRARAMQGTGRRRSVRRRAGHLPRESG